MVRWPRIVGTIIGGGVNDVTKTRNNVYGKNGKRYRRALVLTKVLAVHRWSCALLANRGGDGVLHVVE